MAEFYLNLIQQRETTKVYRDKGKMLGMLALCILLFGCCFLVFWQEAGTGKIPPVKEDLTWLAFTFVAIMFAINVTLIFDRRPAMEFAETGLLARDIAGDVIPWAEIRSVSVRKYKRSNFIELQIDPAIVRGLRPSFLQSKLRFFNKLLGFHHYNIPASMLDHDADFLLQLINFYLQKNSNSEAKAT